MNFEAVADGSQESDGEFPAVMLAEFFEAAENDRLVFGVDVKQFAREQFEPEHFEEAENAGLGGGIDIADPAGINDVESDTDGDGFAVAEAVFGKLLELVRGPVTKIERASGTEFERIARGGDVVEVQFSGA